MVSRKGYTQKKRRGRYRQTKKILLLAVEGKNKTESNYFQSVASPYVDTTRSYGKTADVLEELERYIPGYKKGQEQSFLQRLSGNLQKAIQNAKRLEKYCEENRRRPHHVEFMPSTEVYKIFEDFVRMESK